MLSTRRKQKYPPIRMNRLSSYSLMLHGGAGAMKKQPYDDQVNLEHLRRLLQLGREKLAAGEPAIEVVTFCASLLEDDELFNAGRGSVLNENGQVEMDAALMDGCNLRAGAVAGVRRIKNPIRLAHSVMQHSEHVMLIGDGAMKFAEIQQVEFAAADYFITDQRRRQWQRARHNSHTGLDHDQSETDDKFGTVGAVARDMHGQLAAATSTGGIVNKHFGRVGDSPLIGCGVYADNESCAVSCTGQGEDFIRTVLAKSAADSIRYRQLDATRAAHSAIQDLRNRVNGKGGLILIDSSGLCAAAHTTEKLIHGWIQLGGEAQVSM